MVVVYIVHSSVQIYTHGEDVQCTGARTRGHRGQFAAAATAAHLIDARASERALIVRIVRAAGHVYVCMRRRVSEVESMYTQARTRVSTLCSYSALSSKRPLWKCRERDPDACPSACLPFFIPFLSFARRVFGLGFAW